MSVFLDLASATVILHHKIEGIEIMFSRSLVTNSMPIYFPESRTQFGVNGDAAGTVDSCCF
jgi:L-cysteine desulfidase